MGIRENLIEAKALISVPERWNKGCFARDEHHRPTGPCDRDAICWCSVGALGMVIGGWTNCDVFRSLEYKILSAASRKLSTRPNECATSFNDDKETTHDQVMQMFDLAIEMSSNAV